MQAERLPLPAAYWDPAFLKCLAVAMGELELVQNFDRLYGAALSKAKSQIESIVDRATERQEADMQAFVQFIHDSVYMRLPDDAIHSLRAV